MHCAARRFPLLPGILKALLQLSIQQQKPEIYFPAVCETAVYTFLTAGVFCMYSRCSAALLPVSVSDAAGALTAQLPDSNRTPPFPIQGSILYILKNSFIDPVSCNRYTCRCYRGGCIYA